MVLKCRENLCSENVLQNFSRSARRVQTPRKYIVAMGCADLERITPRLRFGRLGRWSRMAQLYSLHFYNFRMMVPRLARSSLFLNQPAAIRLGYGTEAAVLCHKISDNSATNLGRSTPGRWPASSTSCTRTGALMMSFFVATERADLRKYRAHPKNHGRCGNALEIQLDHPVWIHGRRTFG